MSTKRVDHELEALWDAFHVAVNMTSRELRDWLLTLGSGEQAFPADPDLNLPELGRSVLHVLDKRKTDLTEHDLAVMAQVVELVRTRRAAAPADAAADTAWRHELMALGHDPLKP